MIVPPGGGDGILRLGGCIGVNEEVKDAGGVEMDMQMELDDNITWSMLPSDSASASESSFKSSSSSSMFSCGLSGGIGRFFVM